MKIVYPSRHTSEIEEEHNKPLNKYNSFFIHIHTYDICPEHNTMLLDQYNKLRSNMLNERHALTKLRAELEGRERRLCKHCYARQLILAI